jgi:phage terminase small subunit
MLNPKQERFVHEYLVDLNPKAAYIRAGYKGRGSSADVTACKLLKNPKIAAAVKEARQAIAEKAIAELALTKEWVLDELIDNVRKAKQGEPILDSTASIVGYRKNFQAATAALALIGKELGMFKGSATTDKPKSYSNIEELKERVRERAIKLGLSQPGRL